MCLTFVIISEKLAKLIHLPPQWNTYGDPPNSDLLRRYGHVDLVPLPDGTMGNPADVVEIDADLAVTVCTRSFDPNAIDITGRIDWWLEQGGDEYVEYASLCALMIYSSMHLFTQRVRGRGIRS